MTKEKLKVTEVAVKGLETVSLVLTGLTQAHPAALGLLIMAGCTAGIISTGKKPELEYVWKPLGKLYDGSQELTKALAIVPVAVGGLGVLSSIISAKAAK